MIQSSTFTCLGVTVPRSQLLSMPTSRSTPCTSSETLRGIAQAAIFEVERVKAVWMPSGLSNTADIWWRESLPSVTRRMESFVARIGSLACLRKLSS